MARIPKTIEEYIIQFRCDDCKGWYDVCFYDKNERSNALHDLKEYRFKLPKGHQYRLIKRRSLNPDYKNN